MASKVNALQSVPNWLWGTIETEWVNNPLFIEAASCCHQLRQIIINQPLDSEQLNELVEEHQIALEVMKYAVLRVSKNTDDFLIIQSALDHYYQDINSKHLDFHIYEPLITLPPFNRVQSKAQEEYLDRWIRSRKDPLEREMKKMMKGFDKLHKLHTKQNS